MTDRIFVALPVYRDPECQWTVRDLFRKAAHPERIFVGICWQHLDGDVDRHCFMLQTRPSQVRVRSYLASNVKGLGWARGVAHSLWEGEEYVLQIDSHMRFHVGWDEALIEMLGQCPSDKPVLTTHPACYEPPDRLTCQVIRLGMGPRDSYGLFSPSSASFEQDTPLLHYLFAGGFQFTRSALYREVPYDPDVGFWGEEVAYSARAFTHGWDAFAPHRCLIHHYYLREGMPRPSDDNPQAPDWEARSIDRLRHLLGVSRAEDPSLTAGLDSPFGFGSSRTYQEFQERISQRIERRAPRVSRVKYGEHHEPALPAALTAAVEMNSGQRIPSRRGSPLPADRTSRSSR